MLLLFRNRHPGWNKGSIAYHADDGKVFAQYIIINNKK